MKIGQRLGHIRIEHRLGKGGMGEVFLGHDEVLERPVAVKVLASHARLSEAWRARFLREARLLSRLDHPAICRIHDFVEADGDTCLVLEYIEGQTLRAVAGSLRTGEIVQLMAEVAEALAAAHAEGIIHRDLKPDNVMVTPAGRAKILDFGIARNAIMPVHPATTPRDPTSLPDLPGEGTASLAGTFATEDGAVMGTVQYMSPEQINGLPLTTASDCYSFGIMLHELLTGRPAYGDAAGTDLTLRVARAEVEPPTGVDPDLASLITDLTDLDARRRPDAAGAAVRLRHFLDRPAILRRRRLRRAAAATMAAVVAGATVLVAWTAYRGQRTARITRRLAREAAAIEWRMRAEYLAPEHDVRSAQEEVERHIGAMVAAAREGGRIARGTASAAAGRGWLTLGRYVKARKALEQAWEAGVRDPEVAYTLGVTLGELYREALGRANRLQDPVMARGAREKARRTLRDPALRYLTAARGTTTAPAAYVEALIALYEDRFDDCERCLGSIQDVPSWFYELDRARAALARQRGEQAFALQADAVALRRSYEEAARASERALAVARSDPAVAADLCTDLTAALYVQVASEQRRIERAAIDRARAACETLERLDPGNLTGQLELVELTLAEGLDTELGGGDPIPVLRAAVDRAAGIARSHDHSTAAHYWLGLAAERLGWSELGRGLDVSETIETCMDAFTAVLRLEPGRISARPRLASCAYLGAIHAYWAGEDPRSWIRSGLDAMEALGDRPYALVLNQRSNLLYIRGLWERDHGIDPRPTFAECVSINERLCERATSPMAFHNLAISLSELARETVASGEDPTVFLDRARRAIQRAAAISPDLAELDSLRGILETIRARFVTSSGGDPLPALERGRTLFREALSRNPDDAEMWVARGELELEGARAAIRTGRSPEPWVREGLRAAAQALRHHPGFGPALRLRTALELERARWLLDLGRIPSPAIARARSAASRLLRSVPGDARGHMLLARAALLEGQWLASQEGCGEAIATFQEGLAAARKALEINNRLAPGHRLRAALAEELARCSPEARRRAFLEERDAALTSLESLFSRTGLREGHRPDPFAPPSLN